MEKASSVVTKIKFGILSKTLLIILSLFYLATFLNKNFNLIYGNILLFSLLKFEIYRIISALFVTDNIFELLLNFLVVVSIINYIENKEGTIKTIIKFVINAIILQILLIILFHFIYYLFPIILSFTIKPLPALGIAFCVKHVLITEDKFIVIYPNYKFNDRFLIVVILLIGLIINLNEIKVEFLFSLYYGFLICKFQKYLEYTPSEEEILHIEKNENYKFFFNLDGWVSIEECFFKSNSNFSHEDMSEILDFNTDIESTNKTQQHLNISDLKLNSYATSNTSKSDRLEHLHEHLDLSENPDNSDNTDPNLILEYNESLKTDDALILDLSS